MSRHRWSRVTVVTYYRHQKHGQERCLLNSSAVLVPQAWSGAGGLTERLEKCHGTPEEKHLCVENLGLYKDTD